MTYYLGIIHYSNSNLSSPDDFPVKVISRSRHDDLEIPISHLDITTPIAISQCDYLEIPTSYIEIPISYIVSRDTDFLLRDPKIGSRDSEIKVLKKKCWMS